MKPRDEMAELAEEFLDNRDATAKLVGDAFENMPRAPLALIIDEFLLTSPKIDIAPILRKIAELNQGRLEDLDVPEFQSYLIAGCGMDEGRLKKLIQTLGNFYSLKKAKTDAGTHVAIAARDEDNSGQQNATLSDLLSQRRNRIR